MPTSMFSFISIALATYYVAVTVTRLHGPFAWAARFRHSVWRARGFEPVAMEGTSEPVWLGAPLSPSGPGTARRTLQHDWIAAGVKCPLCVSLYVAPIMLVLSGAGWMGAWLVTALAVAGAASAIFSATS